MDYSHLIESFRKSFKINKNIQRITFSMTIRQTIIFVLTKKKMLSIVTVRYHLL